MPIGRLVARLGEQVRAHGIAVGRGDQDDRARKVIGSSRVNHPALRRTMTKRKRKRERKMTFLSANSTLKLKHTGRNEPE